MLESRKRFTSILYPKTLYLKVVIAVYDLFRCTCRNVKADYLAIVPEFSHRNVSIKNLNNHFLHKLYRFDSVTVLLIF